MRAALLSILLLTLASANAATPALGADPRLREVQYNPGAVVTVLVKRGVVTHVVLAPDESITEVGAGMGGDCSKADAVWCIAAQAGGRNLFVKAKSGANGTNNLAVVTDRRTHAFQFVVLPDRDARAPVYRLVVKAPAHPASLPEITAPLGPSSEELVAGRLKAMPQIMNTSYSIAQGKRSEDIVPTLIFDDGRFTYFRFPGNREVPAVFHVLGDGSETVVNARMEDDMLVVDRVSRHLMLRAGQAVVGVWNEAFDLDGALPVGGTTAPGVERSIKSDGRHAAARPRTSGAAR